MKRILLLGCIMLSATACMAQFGRMRFQKEPAENYTLKTANATMVIDAANGARIMSLKFDTIEVLSQNPAPNMYGSTFWTSPQREWNWPPVREHDMGRYTVEQKEGKIIMTSGLSERIPLRIRKTFSLIDDMYFAITYSITNEGTEERRVAPWEVTRVPGEGNISFDAPIDSIWPAGVMDFKVYVDDAKRGINKVVYDIDKADKQRKINANGRPLTTGNNKQIYKGMSWLRYSNNGIELTKYFPDLKAGEVAPGEDEIQVYVHQDALYCELEEQGPYTLLNPGESLDWTVYWHVTPSSTR